MDKISCIIILRALFVFSLIEKGWSVRKSKENSTFEIFKSVKKEVI
jgi:broad-specificity NMP kinase